MKEFWKKLFRINKKEKNRMRVKRWRDKHPSYRKKLYITKEKPEGRGVAWKKKQNKNQDYRQTQILYKRKKRLEKKLSKKKKPD